MHGARKLLIVSPHPDDESLGCGGLISYANRTGMEIFVLFLCVGKCRQLITGGTEENTRLEETKVVAERGNFKYKFVFIGDEFMRLDSLPQKSVLDPIEDTIKEFQPDIVCVPSQNSYDQDHRAVYTAAITALRPIPQSIRHFPKMVLEYEEPYTWSVGDAFKPNFYLPLTEQDMEFKFNLIKGHATQLREEPFARSLENLRRLAKLRGAEIGLEYAEAYRLLRGVV